MSHLSKKKPSPSQLLKLDPLDLSFMTLTGNLKFIDPLTVIAAKLKADGSVLLWGPESKLMEVALWRAWESEAAQLNKEIQEAFDLSGDVAVNEAAILAAFGVHSDAGGRVMKGEMIWQGIIHGEPASKANSRQAVPGRRKDGR